MIWSGGWDLRKDLLQRLSDLGGTQGRNTKVGKGSRKWEPERTCRGKITEDTDNSTQKQWCMTPQGGTWGI